MAYKSLEWWFSTCYHESKHNYLSISNNIWHWKRHGDWWSLHQSNNDNINCYGRLFKWKIPICNITWNTFASSSAWVEGLKLWTLTKKQKSLTLSVKVWNSFFSLLNLNRNLNPNFEPWLHKGPWKSNKQQRLFKFNKKMVLLVDLNYLCYCLMWVLTHVGFFLGAKTFSNLIGAWWCWRWWWSMNNPIQQHRLCW